MNTLAATMDWAAQQRFHLGTYDCRVLTLRCIEEWYDVDLSGAVPEWVTAGAPLRIYRSIDGGMMGVARRVFGAPRKSPLQACAGDVALIPSGCEDHFGGLAFGFVGPQGVIVPGATGVVLAPVRTAVAVWEVRSCLP